MVAASLLRIALGPVLGVVEKYIDKQADKDKLKAEIETALIGAGSELAKLQAEVVTSEIRGDWLQRSWRPITALLFVFVVFWFAWIQPASVAWWGWTPLRIGDPLLIEVLSIVKLCLGGYIGGRSIEKVASVTAQAVTSWRK